jgi:hypothetical protein
MGQAGNQSCLALKPQTKVLVGRAAMYQSLNGDGTVQSSFTGAVHLAHSARTDEGKNLV